MQHPKFASVVNLPRFLGFVEILEIILHIACGESKIQICRPIKSSIFQLRVVAGLNLKVNC